MRIQTQIYLGWTPILAVVIDGSRNVLQVTGWEGGSGTVPATGLYVGATGYVPLIANAVNIKGQDGSAGATGTSYTHTQGVVASTWNVTHNLGYFPAVTIVDSADTQVVGDIQYTSPDTLIITFSTAFSGKAYMS
jgi:hypothetical protein